MDRNAPRFGENSEELLEVELGTVCRKNKAEDFLPHAQISHLEGLGEELL